MKIIGHLDVVRKEIISGWAVSRENNTPLLIKLLINDQLATITTANKFRQDLLDSSIHPTGKCSYAINSVPLPDTAVIRVIANDINGKETELVNSPWYYCDEKFLSEKSAELLINPKYKQGNKVLIVGLPKSGTSILTYSIANALENKTINFEPGTKAGLKDILLHENLSTEENVVTKCTVQTIDNLQLDTISLYYNKHIWIIRDFRDHIISEFFYSWYKDFNPNPDSFEKALKLVKEKEANPNSVPFYKIYMTRHEYGSKENLQEMLKTKSSRITGFIKNLDSKWFLLKYEDLMDKKIHNLNQYLKFAVKTDTSVPSEYNRVVRSKKYGNWRNWFTEEDIQFFKPIFTDILNGLGYESTDWALNKDQILPPELGSSYMEKLFTKI